MKPLLARVYQALAALPCAVTRAWPQTLVPLPSIAFCVASARTVKPGVTQCGLRLEVRANTPEAADTLAASARGYMEALGFSLDDWRDGEATQSGCYTVTLLMGGCVDPDGLPAPAAQVLVTGSGPAVPVGGITHVEPHLQERLMDDVTQAADSVRRYVPHPVSLGLVAFTAHRLPADPGQTLLRTAFDLGTALTVTLFDSPNDPTTAQGYVARMTASGPELTVVIQLTA